MDRPDLVLAVHLNVHQILVAFMPLADDVPLDPSRIAMPVGTARLALSRNPSSPIQF